MHIDEASVIDLNLSSNQHNKLDISIGLVLAILSNSLKAERNPEGVCFTEVMSEFKWSAEAAVSQRV